MTKVRCDRNDCAYNKERICQKEEVELCLRTMYEDERCISFLSGTSREGYQIRMRRL